MPESAQTPAGALQRHPHADLIHLWAEGAPIQYQPPGVGYWLNISYPSWSPSIVYRVAPGFRTYSDEDAAIITACRALKRERPPVHPLVAALKAGYSITIPEQGWCYLAELLPASTFVQLMTVDGRIYTGVLGNFTVPDFAQTLYVRLPNPAAADF